MRECSRCHCVQDEDQFISNNVYERRRGILTAMCQTCRDTNNHYRRRWYATYEQTRIGLKPIP